ncbi:MAG: hypothetical protein IJ856_06285 [Candidatus Methanomethylophilaceae archaeon]|nr:hypothetical protein [Candidatus Methanomethylophilaceae archaeon]
MAIMTEVKLRNRVLVITNDSTVFTNKTGVASAFDMFAGRATEVKNLVARLDTMVDDKGRKVCDVSYGVISTFYGFVPGNYTVMAYDRVMSTPEEYEYVDSKRGFVEQTSFLCKAFDIVIFCIPKAMFGMFLDRGDIDDGKVIAVTSPDFKDRCTEREWIFLERTGPRVGASNADEIERLVREVCSTEE